MTTAIEARDLVKTYPGGVRALDGASFTVDAGTIFGLLGPNGAGKTTTVKILTTLSRPDSGQARVAGYDVLRETELVRQVIGVVGQRCARASTARRQRVRCGQGRSPCRGPPTGTSSGDGGGGGHER